MSPIARPVRSPSNNHHVSGRPRSVIGRIAVVAACIGVVTLSVWLSRTHHTPASSHSRFVVPGETASFLNGAYANGTPLVQEPNGPVRAGIMPHHTLVSPLMAAFFSGLSNQPAPSTVVVIGPDHDRRGLGYVTTTRNGWMTPDGTLDANTAVVDGLVADQAAVIDNATVGNEHGTYAILPFVKRQFPHATIVQLVIRPDLRPDRLNQLAADLNRLLQPDDLVIASVDFSHYKDVTGAWSDDAITVPAISAEDETAALHIPVDSPPSISLLLRYAKLRGLAYQQLVHTNSAEFLHDLTLASTTSYLTAYFYQP